MPQTSIVLDTARRSQEVYTLLERAIETGTKKPKELVKRIDELSSSYEATKNIIHNLKCLATDMTDALDHDEWGAEDRTNLAGIYAIVQWQVRGELSANDPGAPFIPRMRTQTHYAKGEAEKLRDNYESLVDQALSLEKDKEGLTELYPCLQDRKSVV